MRPWRSGLFIIYLCHVARPNRRFFVGIRVTASICFHVRLTRQRGPAETSALVGRWSLRLSRRLTDHHRAFVDAFLSTL